MFRLFNAVILFLIICAFGAGSIAREHADVKVTANAKYTRLFFYSRQPLKFSTALEGNKLAISFRHDVEIDSAAIAAAGGEISAAAFSKNNNTATVTLIGSAYKIRKFIGENFVGLDIIKSSGEMAAKLPQKTAYRKKSPPEAAIEPSAGADKPVMVKEVNDIKRDDVTQSANKNLSVPESKQQEAAAKPDAAAPQVKAPDATTAPVAEEIATTAKTEAAPKTAPEPDKTAEGYVTQKPAPEIKVEAKPAMATTAAAPEPDTSDKSAQSSAVTPIIAEKPPAEPEQDLASDDEATKVPALPMAQRVKDKLLAKMVFAWKEPVAASIFKRAGYLWVVFDKSMPVNIQEIIAKNPAYIQSGHQMPNREYTILRLKLKTDVNTVAYKEENNWVVGLLSDKIVPEKSSNVAMKFSNLNGSRVLLDSDTPLKPLRLTDVEVGDELVILPYMEESTGIKEKYKYVDFVFLVTSQGAVIQIISDNVDVAVVDTGVAVAGPANVIDNMAQSALKELKAKEEAENLGAEKLKQQSAELSLLKFNTWMLGGSRLFKRDLQELEWKIAEVDWSEKGKYRLALARFYLAHGLDAEAIGVINILREYDAKLAKETDVKMVEATAYYMMGRFKDAVDIYDTINLDELKGSNQAEVLFWRTAADINIGNQVRLDKFITKNPLKKEDAEEEGGENKVENTKLMQDTSMRLLKMIRKMDPDFVNADELQKLEATARFVTGHYQEAIRRFEETELFSSGDIFQAEDNKLWWSTQASKRADSAALKFLPNIDDFLKNYPDHLFNDFAMLALEDELKRNDLTKAEEIMAVFRTEDRFVQKDSMEFFRGLYYAKNEEVDKAVDTWKKLTEEVADPYNRTRAQFALTVFQLDKKQIDVKQAIANLNSVRAIWRGGQLEFHILVLLGEFYMENMQPMEGFMVWREAISAFPGSDESLLIAKKMSTNFVKLFSQGGADKLPQIDAITLYYEFRELTPIGKLGDDMISKLVDRLIKVDLLDRAAALLTHQVRFRLAGEERDVAAAKLIKIHLMNHDAQKALDVLDATQSPNIKPEVALERRYMRAQALLELGKNNMVLTMLNEDSSKDAAFLRADVYWRNHVWRKVVDELEVPFREIRRDEKKLNSDEANQVIRLAVAYALMDRQKRLQILYEDFSDLIDDVAKKKLLTFIATNKGPVDYKNLEQTVEYKEMENFLNGYMKPAKAGETSPSAQAVQPAPAG